MKFVYLTVVLTVYSQLIVKWRVSRASALPADWSHRLSFLAGLLCDPWVLSGVFATFVGGLCWMVAMTKVELSYAYPFIGLVFVLILISSSVLFHEAITLTKVIGVLLVIAGIFVVSRG
jgi:drug/metabolite transporter (DMT)-like permease